MRKMSPIGPMAFVGLVLLTTTGMAQPTLQLIPEEHPGPPFYNRGLVDPDLGLVPVVFYRPPEKVPADFNLMNFFDIPRALTVEPLLVTGFHIFDELEPPAAPPFLQVLSGDAVPVWFVETDVLLAAIGDGEVTICELEEIVAHKGVATDFSEVIRPSPAPDGTGGAVVWVYDLVARGKLEDGSSFFLHAVENEPTERLRVRLSIREARTERRP